MGSKLNYALSKVTYFNIYHPNTVSQHRQGQYILFIKTSTENYIFIVNLNQTGIFFISQIASSIVS